MALINCSECKKEISDTVKQCPNCGYKVKKSRVKDKFNDKNSNKRKTKRIIYVCAGFIVLLLIAGLTFYFVTADSRIYGKAISIYNTGDYDDAITVFSTIPNYADSQEMIQKSNYHKAYSLFENKQYSEAERLFVKCKGYADSNEKIKECKYALGTEAYDLSDWDNAIEYFTDLKYLDSEDLFNNSIREKGMSENADYEFIQAIEDSVNNRQVMIEKGASLSEIVDAELYRLGTFKDKVFYDKDLDKLAESYITGLDVQKDALSKKYSEYQIMWYEGMVQRYETLCSLNEDYGAFSDDARFIDTYKTQLDENINYLDALKTIDADLVSQLDGVEFKYVNSYTMSAMYTNNTKYDFDITFYFTFYKDEVRVDETTDYFQNIKAGEKNDLSFYIPTTKWNTCDFFWEITPV